MMRALPGLGLLLVAFGAGIRTDDLGRIGRNCAKRGKAESHQHAAEIKHGRKSPEPKRPKAMHSENHNDFSFSLQPSILLQPSLRQHRQIPLVAGAIEGELAHPPAGGRCEPLHGAG